MRHYSYIGTQCTAFIVQGTDNFYKNVNEGTKNIGEAASGAINCLSGALDTDHIERLTAIDSHGSTITLKPVPGLNGSNLSCTGLYIKPVNSDQDVFIENISELYWSLLKIQNLITSKLDGETVLQRFTERSFDL